ncbi:MAG TPA: hypothetical protein VGO37_00650 [Steroidobacteraceae bacterium]|jgi:hypothetical protein|nr:hypothetical protein [Steroidobacteraceae bacterium]
MRFFKRGARQTTPVAKNVSVTELLMRGDTVRPAADTVAPKASPGQRTQVPELNAGSKEAVEGLRGPTF